MRETSIGRATTKDCGPAPSPVAVTFISKIFQKMLVSIKEKLGLRSSEIIGLSSNLRDNNLTTCELVGSSKKISIDFKEMHYVDQIHFSLSTHSRGNE